MINKKDVLFGTKEWAPHNFNFTNGCSNNCTYCYAKEMAIRFKRKTADTWKVEEPATMQGKSFRKRNGRIMIPSSHDITPSNIDMAMEVIEKLLESGNELLIVTKPHFSCIKRITNQFLQYKKKIQFRFTIGSSSSEVLKLWEPGATGFEERMASLAYAYSQGYSTSISAEPLLDKDIDNIYAHVNPFVTDSIWVGKMNFASRRTKVNSASKELPSHVLDLIAAQSNDAIMNIWNKYKDNPKVEWKESIKKVISDHSLSNSVIDGI